MYGTVARKRKMHALTSFGHILKDKDGFYFTKLAIKLLIFYHSQDFIHSFYILLANKSLVTFCIKTDFLYIGHSKNQL